MKRNWIRGIIGGLSFSTALFVFQACYGTPQDFGLDSLVSGKVVSAATGLPLSGIKVSAADMMQHQITDKEGRFSFYVPQVQKLNFSFEDIDGEQNGLYAKKDSVISTLKKEVVLDIKLQPAK